ncbi:helix-turn-helix domain-containing protein [Actinomadura sp. LD22]|uniref:Helix-turn-helix domain-containing protein n=1 Tax=Actinomadura physcomitrii TaxID=2650748 RepID=A0A6I4MHU5_9ACTN|nr:helix-turn-helix transcriptional regulator [Actinomadura physcomitrii]MWA05748.1 helix-turn-helix domain-containing protein [Actinomadura physcomitrii]
MPRPESPLDPSAGPVPAFAQDLRNLRVEAGSPSYRALEAVSHCGRTTLANAASGRRLPTWEVTRAYVEACGGDVDAWRRKWRTTAALVKAEGRASGTPVPARELARTATGRRSPHPSPQADDPLQAATPDELVGMLRRLCRRARIEPHQLPRLSAKAKGTDVYAALSGAQMSGLFYGHRAPRAHEVLRIVELCRVDTGQMRLWAIACARLLQAPAARPEEAASGRPGAGNGGAGDLAQRPAGAAYPERVLLGVMLHRLREARGLPAREAGGAIGASPAKISRMELGQVSLREPDVAALLTLYGVEDGSLAGSLLDLARGAPSPGSGNRRDDGPTAWLRAYSGLEESASLIRTSGIRHIPSLLQTEAYARAVTARSVPHLAAHDVDELVRLRMARQRRFAADAGRRLWAIVDERVLRRPVGPPPVWQEQIAHLISVSTWPNVTLQILPSRSRPRRACRGQMTWLRFGDGGLPDVMCREGATGIDYVTEPSDVNAHMVALNTLGVHAQWPDKSLEILTEILQDPTPEAPGWFTGRPTLPPPGGDRKRR